TLGEKDLTTPSPEARLFLWENKDTLCLLLKRGDDEGLNGTHCYNTKTCDVCAYDGRGKKFDALQEGKKVEDNCTRCHLSGPILPKNKIWNAAAHLTYDLNSLCVSQGGPRWVDAPSDWTQPDLDRRVDAPVSCTQCHSYFVRGNNFCQI